MFPVSKQVNIAARTKKALINAEISGPLTSWGFLQGSHHPESPGAHRGPSHPSPVRRHLPSSRQPARLPNFPAALVRRHQGRASSERSGNGGDVYSLLGHARVKRVSLGGRFRQGGAGLLDLAQLLVRDDVEHGVVWGPEVRVRAWTAEADGEGEKHSRLCTGWAERLGEARGAAMLEEPPGHTECSPRRQLCGCARTGCWDMPGAAWGPQRRWKASSGDCSRALSQGLGEVPSSHQGPGLRREEQQSPTRKDPDRQGNALLLLRPP